MGNFYTVTHADCLPISQMSDEQRHALNYSLAEMIGFEDHLTEIPGNKRLLPAWLEVIDATTEWWEPTGNLRQAVYCLSKIPSEAGMDRVLECLHSIMHEELGPGDYREKYLIFHQTPEVICIAIARALAA